MSERVNPFANINKELPVFTTKTKTEKPVAEEALARVAEDNDFTSRQAPKPKKAERRKPRVHRTGRNVQFNSKVTAETLARIYKAADEHGVVIGEVLRLAMDALERDGSSVSREATPSN
jgi:hypothetical protein